MLYYLWFQLIIPLARKEPIDQTKVDRFKADLPEVIGHIDKYFLRGHNFIGGNEDVSVADLLAVCELMQLYPVFEEEIYESNHNVKAWMLRVKARLQPHFDEGHSVTYRTRVAYKKLEPSLRGQSKL